MYWASLGSSRIWHYRHNRSHVCGDTAPHGRKRNHRAPTHERLNRPSKRDAFGISRRKEFINCIGDRLLPRSCIAWSTEKIGRRSVEIRNPANDWGALALSKQRQSHAARSHIHPFCDSRLRCREETAPSQDRNAPRPISLRRMEPSRQLPRSSELAGEAPSFGKFSPRNSLQPQTRIWVVLLGSLYSIPGTTKISGAVAASHATRYACHFSSLNPRSCSVIIKTRYLRLVNPAANAGQAPFCGVRPFRVDIKEKRNPSGRWIRPLSTELVTNRGEEIAHENPPVAPAPIVPRGSFRKAQKVAYRAED